MKYAVIVIALFLASCNKQAAVVNPPSTGPSNLVLTLDAIEVSCAAALPNVTSPLAVAWLQTCPTTIAASIAAVSAPNATVAVLTTLNQFLAAAPLTASGVPASDVAIVKSVSGAVTTFIALYQSQVTGTT